MGRRGGRVRRRAACAGRRADGNGVVAHILQPTYCTAFVSAAATTAARTSISSRTTTTSAAAKTVSSGPGSNEQQGDDARW